MSDEMEFLRQENFKLKAKIAGLEQRHAELLRKTNETFELNEVLQNRLRANGLSPYILPTEEEKAEVVTPQIPVQPKAKTQALTPKMLIALREVVDGVAVDHGRTITSRERAGRGRTLDALKERGLLDSAYQPTCSARAVVAHYVAENMGG